jgi:hypothetical protein
MKKRAMFLVLSMIFGIFVFVSLFALEFLDDIEILFYRGILIILISCLAQFLVTRLAVRLFGLSEIFQAHAVSAMLASLCIFSVFFVVIPVSLDRSVSVFILGHMENNKNPMSKQQIEDIFISEYVKNYGAIDRRLGEQIKSGNITKLPDGTYEISGRGSTFIVVSRKIAKNFGVDPKFLDPPGRPAKPD